MSNHPTLYYVHDPMCSWCWGFQKVWPTVQLHFEQQLEIKYLVGGLASDSDDPMPESMQSAIAGYWRNIESRIPGTEFNYDFWSKCKPRRSTYPACRAVVSAKILQAQKEVEMINAIQSAYYLQAKNPSDDSTLIDCATSIGFDQSTFEKQFYSEATNDLFFSEMNKAGRLGAQGFPSLILENQQQIQRIAIDYNSAEFIINEINLAIK